MIKLKELMEATTLPKNRTKKDTIGDDVIDFGIAYAPNDDENRQIVIFDETGNAYDITRANDVKYLKTFKDSDIRKLRRMGATHVKDATIFQEKGKLRWEY